MIELTTRAHKHLDRYLGEVRASLAACPSVDSVDVERDVREHIDKSLSESPKPVDLPDLARVLEQLGSPSQWVTEEELPWRRKLRLRIRRIVTRLCSGPEDFRLAYLSIALFALALFTFAAGAAPLAFFFFGFSFLDWFCFRVYAVNQQRVLRHFFYLYFFLENKSGISSMSCVISPDKPKVLKTAST